MGYFSLKDTNKNGKPTLYFMFYNPENWKQRVEEIKKSGQKVDYQNISRRNVSISLGTYNDVRHMDKSQWREIAVDKLLNPSKRVKRKTDISEDELKVVLNDFDSVKGYEEQLLKEEAIIQFDFYVRYTTIQNYFTNMSAQDKFDAIEENLTYMQWATNEYEFNRATTIEGLKDTLGITNKAAVEEYRQIMMKKYGNAFRKESPTLARVLGLLEPAA
jgi:hypothetical protein